jgi:hypothetical protein
LAGKRKPGQASAFDALDGWWAMMYPHAGIRIDRIPAEEGGGLIFAVGTAAIFLIAFPALVPIAGAALLGGIVLAPILHKLYR